ncbi:N-acetyltransferase [Streptomyces syringium]|uniref:N-acetyltransferase n=1 Tax=Streptomyces syringium TaxID=76729 RepID=UPI0034436ABF
MRGATEPEARRPEVDVSLVAGRKAITEFIRLPVDLYREDPFWVAPLEFERRQFLDRRRNPFFAYGDVRLFLARRGERVTGRIAAVRNPRYESFQGKRHGFFGLFECADDVETARALFDAVGRWLGGFGLETLLGPMSFSTNDECGTLISGFDSAPTVLMPHNPPYYSRLYTRCEFAKAMDLWTWRRDVTAPPHFLLDQAERASRAHDIVVRPADLRRLDAELSLIMGIYNSAWQANWGAVPLTPAEATHLAGRLRPVLRTELVLIAECGGVPAAFLLVVPDANEALAAARGRLTHWGLPIGLARLTRAARHIEGLRVIGFGVLEEYRRLGLDAVLLAQAWRNALRLGYQRAEGSWVLEENVRLNRMADMLGAERHKTYRIYQRPLVDTPAPAKGRW